MSKDHLSDLEWLESLTDLEFEFVGLLINGLIEREERQNAPA
jgi:hypothetical protein